MITTSMKILGVVVLVGMGELSAAYASPLDGPDTIYVDGQPCGTFCQSYLRATGVIRPLPSPNSQAPYRPAVLHQGGPRKSPAEGTRRVARRSGAQAAVPMPVARPSESQRPLLSASTKVVASPSNARRLAPEVADAHARVMRSDAAILSTPPSFDAATKRPASVDSKSAAEVKEQRSLPPEKKSNAAELPSERDLPTVPGASDSHTVELSREQPAPPTNENSGLIDPNPEQSLSNAAPALSEQWSPTETGSPDREEQATVQSAPSLPVTPETGNPTSSTAIDHPNGVAAAPAQPLPEVALPDRQEQVAALSSPSGAIASKLEKPAPLTAVEGRVAVIMVRPEIASISDLTSKDIAIDLRQAPSREMVRTALATAGASGTNLSDGEAKALDRLLGGEVPAAVLAVLSAAAAENFPNIAGFRLFRIPLTSNH